jgi:hypothetical protein
MNVWLLRWGGYQEPDPQDPTPNFALVRRDFTPLPAYDMLKAYMAREPVAGAGVHAWDHPAVQRQVADTWQIRFEGTSFALYRMQAPLTVAIDGGAPVGFNPLIGGGTVTIAGQMPDGIHTAVLRGPAPPGAFLVGRAPPLPWLWVLAPALIVAGLVLVGALIARVLAR